MKGEASATAGMRPSPVFGSAMILTAPESVDSHSAACAACSRYLHCEVTMFRPPLLFVPAGVRGASPLKVGQGASAHCPRDLVKFFTMPAICQVEIWRVTVPPLS